MGKQINYYMEYESFLTVAQKAVDMGMSIIYSRYEENNCRKLIFCEDISEIPENSRDWYFYFPSDGKPHIMTYHEGGSEHIELNALHKVIEAGFSSVDHDKREISTNRLYSMTGIWLDENTWQPRPEQIEKAYGSLVRAVKKAAPYTPITHKNTAELSAEEKKLLPKEYITPYCFELWEQGYYIGKAYDY